MQENNGIELLINENIADFNHEFFKMQKVIYLPAEVSFSEYNINSPTILKEENRDLKLDSNKITLDKLSSGEKQIFYKGGSLLQFTKQNNVIILLDEPETSLHPEWQQKILDFYKNINKENQYIFATHSAHIVACCNKEKIRLLGKEGDYIVLRDILNETYGATNEELLYEIFDLYSQS